MDENQVEGAATEFGGKVKSTIGDVTGDTKSQASGTVDQITGAAQRTYGKIKDTVTNGAGSSVADQLDEVSAYIGDTVAERPLTSLLVAGAVGYVLAMLTRR